MGKISLLLPVYNEQVILKDVLAKYIADLENIRLKKQYQWEIIAVDDCSDDESRLIMLDFARQYQNFRIVTLAERVGKHSAVTAGLSVATGDLILMAEIDLQNPLGFLEALVQDHLDSGVPIIYGYRQFNGWQRRKALMTDRLTRFACRLFVLDGYFTGIVNAELYTADVAAVLRDNPSKTKYMRSMNNWVGWESKEFWYASEYTDSEVKARTEQLRQRTHGRGHVKPRRQVAPLDVWWGVLFLMLAGIAFTLGIIFTPTAHVILLGILFTIGFAGVVLALLSFLRALLLARVGKVRYRAGEVIYEIKSILNR
ncbi:MAG: glycosyltransferase family 2 protein [Clostridia bacterium]|nr:glycosyltransferase family 2 protein [Clostridia bacterium]